MTLDVPYGKRFYRVKRDMRLLCEVEAELGGMAALQNRLRSECWTVTELVTLVQILLQAAGLTADFMQLGDEMLQRGLGHYLALAEKLAGITQR
ncbi:MAG: hypothetical protein GC185_07620 [Alphaproteobacteria bacterium]|nr:hypothetical protein [Alphaproteobacteria bacterium]